MLQPRMIVKIKKGDRNINLVPESFDPLNIQGPNITI